MVYYYTSGLEIRKQRVFRKFENFNATTSNSNKDHPWVSKKVS